ncbi:MAG: DUF4386 family protein [Anaerolineae bacterium]|nr:DUF4386 family protein [Anaerolineae bacterium]
MSQSQRNEVTGPKIAEPRWKDLYKIGGITAIISEILIVLGIIAFVIWPYTPGYTSAENIFTAIQNDWLGGLMALDFFLFMGNLFGILLFLVLYVSLKQVNESYALIALVLGLFADVLIVPARPMAELFSLSDLYAAATTEAAKNQYLAAGEALLALFNGTAWMTNTFLGGFSLLISSFLMLRSNIFSKSTAWIGIITNTAVCGFFLPVVGTVLLFLSVPGYIIWYIQLARRFFQLGQLAIPDKQYGG